VLVCHCDQIGVAIRVRRLGSVLDLGAPELLISQLADCADRG